MDPTPTDFELLDAWRGSDTEAGNELFRRHFPTVCRFFKNKVDTGVDDLVQSTFLACVEGQHRLREETSFRAYLLGIARYQLYGWYRTKKRDVDFESTSVVDLGGSPSQAFAKAEEQRLLLYALRHIPVDFQIVLELYYWEGIKGPELAEVLDVSPHTIRSRLSRARASLREALERLARSPELLAHTLEDLEGWARRLRDEAGSAAPLR